jgi:hypothetical protein
MDEASFGPETRCRQNLQQPRPVPLDPGRHHLSDAEPLMRPATMTLRTERRPLVNTIYSLGAIPMNASFTGRETHLLNHSGGL